MNSHSFLKGKTAIVTGGSGVIGKSITKALLGNGCKVFITGRNAERLHDAKVDLTDALGDDMGRNVFTFVGDVCDEESVSNLFDAVEKECQHGCDLLINNAGINAAGSIENLSVDDFTRVMAVNVVGPFTCAREAIGRMKKREQGGRIINIGSLSAISPRPDSIPYTTSKFALLGLTNSLALDARQYNIAVGVIHPGNVISTLLTPETIEERGKLEGFIEADDVAACVMTMASMPYTTNILELTVMPTKQPLIGRG